MRKHRLAVIGCGAMAQSIHLPNVQNNPRIDLVCTCDINGTVAAECARRFHAQRAETDWRKVVESKDVDIIVLATHHNLRGEIIIPALRAKKAVYTEKPLAPSREEMLEIVRASRETKVPVCVGHNRRSSPAILEFKRLLDKAFVVRRVSVPSISHSGKRKYIPEEQQLQLLMRINDDIRSWKEWIFYDQEGIFFAEMVHFVDLAMWFNRTRPVRCFAEGSCRGNFVMVLRFADASITTIYHTMVGHFDYPKELIEASLRNITIAMDQHIEVRQVGLEDEPNLAVFPYAKECTWAKKQGMTGYFHEIYKERRRILSKGHKPRCLNVNKGHYEHLDRFLNHIEGKGDNPCDIEDAIAVNRITLKLLESVRLGLPVVIGPEDWHVPK